MLMLLLRWLLLLLLLLLLWIHEEALLLLLMEVMVGVLADELLDEAGVVDAADADAAELEGGAVGAEVVRQVAGRQGRHVGRFLRRESDKFR